MTLSSSSIRGSRLYGDSIYQVDRFSAPLHGESAGHGGDDFERFEKEQCELAGTWRQSAMNPSLPFRVVVYNAHGERVESEDGFISQT